MQKYSTLLILLIFFACSSDEGKLPEGIIPPEKMSELFADMQIAEAIVRNESHKGDTDAQRIVDYYGFIYRKHNVSDTLFKTSYEYYLHHPVLLDSVYAAAITRLSDREARLKAK